MTDINNWPYLIRREVIPPEADQQFDQPHLQRPDLGPEHGYILLPFNEYQIGNLLGLLKRTREMRDGDWFIEIVSLIAVAMERLKISAVKSNSGEVFTIESIESGDWLRA